jgi:chemotaxis family two-component system sensor kinase Cph1
VITFKLIFFLKPKPFLAYHGGIAYIGDGRVGIIMTYLPSKFGDYFTAILTHDISNFNQTSRGYLEMLLNEQMGSLTPEQVRSLGNCMRQSRRVQSLIESIRLLIDIDAKEIDLQPINLDGAIKEAMHSVQTDYFDREIRLHHTPANRMALAEPQLKNMLMHLFSNAVRHNDCEIVEVEIKVSLLESPSPTWQLFVEDNGIGIAEKRRSSLFERFEKLDVHGAGLGLSVGKYLLKRWGGEIWLERSEVGKGSVFGVSLKSA